ncbi:MAG TPA: hypothetical protein VFE34_24845 [Dongiaceae bacterium]|jgi:hypothetical protein|nr:hypothetical protein [Dongiaceae bacterium]
MNLEVSARNYEPDVVEELEYIATTAKRISRVACVIYGSAAKPESLIAFVSNAVATGRKNRSAFRTRLPPATQDPKQMPHGAASLWNDYGKN